MSEAEHLLAGYLRQRIDAGESPVVLPAHRTSEAARNDGPPIPPPADPPKWLRGAPDIPGRGVIIPSPPKDLFTADPLSGLDLAGLAGRIAECRLCSLCQERTRTVPGQGPAAARMVLVGEGPGANEDRQGLAFVGRAGELLTEILAAVDLLRDQVFICNVVKCRPPANRKPLPDEIAACVPYLHRQIELIRPAVLLAMGGTAAETLLNTKQPLGALRGKVHEFRGIPLIGTYHPAALLRNPHWKKPTWDDVRIARRLLDRR